MYVHMCVSLYIFVCLYEYDRVCPCVPLSLCMCVHVCVSVCLYVCLCVSVCDVGTIFTWHQLVGLSHSGKAFTLATAFKGLGRF